MFNGLLVAAGRAADLCAVDGVLADMRSASVSPNEFTHGALVNALVRCGELGRAAETLRAARAMQPPAGVQAYTALVQAYARAGDFERSRAVIADMSLAGVQPNVITHTTLLDGLVRAGRVDEARDLLNAVPDANTVSFNVVLRGYAADGRTRDAILLLETMERRGAVPNLASYNTLLAACMDDAQACTHILSLMLQACVTPDVATTTTLIASAGRCGNVELARTLFFSCVHSSKEQRILSCY
jgi:leucine-rich PPR motif-containing protein